MRSPKELSPEDQARVESVLHTGYNAVERKPFRPLVLLAVIWLVVALIGGISYLIAWFHDVV